MDVWSILDKSKYSEDYADVGDPNGDTNNFSLKISTILSTQFYKEVPVFKSVVCPPFICIYFNSTVLIFSNPKCEDVRLLKTFDSKINNVFIQMGSNMLVVVTDNGILHTIDFDSTKHKFSNECIIDKKYSIMFMHEELDSSIVIVTTDLLYYRLKITLFSETEDTSDILQFSINRIRADEVDEKTTFHLKMMQNELHKMNNSAICVKSSQFQNIEIVCPNTYQSITPYTEIAAKCIKPLKNSTKFMFLKVTSTGENELCVADFYKSSVDLSVSVSVNCFLVGGINDTAIYLDVNKEKIYVYQMIENSPLSQLENLIALRNYEDAEAFAKSNNLSQTSVVELKAKVLLNNLKKTFSPEVLAELKDALIACKNINFLIACCIEGAEYNVNLYVLLEFAKNQMLDFEDHTITARVNELLWKADIFNHLQYEELTEEVEWSKFINEDAISLCKHFLADDHLDIASLVWMKCFPNIVSVLRSKNVSEILNAISTETKLNCLLRWLEHFIPDVVNTLPYCTDIIVNWAQDRVCLLESSRHWPEVGIQLAEKFAFIIFNVKVPITFMPVTGDRFYYLIHCLKNIQTLKTSYNIIVSLKDFMSLPANEFAKLVLRKAFNEDLNSLLSNYLEKFVIRHDLNHDSLLKEHIEELISLSPVIDEDRMETLLGHIQSTEERMQCILLVLKSCKVPWTDNIRKIADKTLESGHHLATKVRMEILHAEIKGILMKYKFHELMSEDYEYLIRLIIKKGDAEMMSDIDKVTSVYCSLKDDAYLLCIIKYLECKEVQAALQLFNDMNESFKVMCINTIVLRLENLLNSTTVHPLLESSFLDFLNCLTYINAITLKFLNNIFILKNKFKLQISLSEYFIEEYRYFVFMNWCKDKLEIHSRSNSDSVSNLLKDAVQVGVYLMIGKSESLLSSAEITNDAMQKSVARAIFSKGSHYLDKNIKSVDLIVKLISNVDISDINVLESLLKCIIDVSEVCDFKHLEYCINIGSWLTAIYFAHNNTKEILSAWKISSIYNPHIMMVSIIPLWKEIVSHNVSMNFKSNKISVCLCDESARCVYGSDCLKDLLRKFQSQQNDLHFARISACTTVTLLKSNESLSDWFSDLTDGMIKNLILKIIILEQPDHLFISNLIFSHSSPVEWLNDMLGSTDSHRKINIADYILRCKDMFFHINIPYKQAFHTYSQNNIASKLEGYGISYKDYDNENTTSVNSLLESIVNVDSFNILTLEEFCLVTNISLDQALMFYLFSILKSWNADYTFVYDSFGQCDTVNNSTTCDILQKCLSIADKVSHKSDLIENLSTLIRHGEINFQNLTTVTLSQYCYEVYLFILELLKRITGQQMFLKEYLLLKFLQTYSRVSKPKQCELDLYSMKETFPKIGYHRLPFQSLISPEFWNNLKSEVTLSTYKRWVSVVGLLPLNEDLQVSSDMICSNAVRQSMTSQKTINEATGCKWSLHIKNNHLLKEAHNCIQHISNLEWAGACFYYVFQGSSFGADQVAAANMCYQFAERWAEVQPNNNVVKKMQSKHLLTSTAHVLHKIDLAEDKLLLLCDNPHRLIETLYNHNIILAPHERPDINSAVDEIAEKNGLNSATVRMNILERILNISNSNNPHGKTNTSEDGTLNKETLVKACYILKATNPMLSALYLSRIGLEESESVGQYNNKIRAIQCLLSLADDDVIEKVTNYSVIDLWSKLRTFYFINNLNFIGLEFLSPIFHDDKTQAIKQIWHAREHNCSTISLISKLLCTYKLQVDYGFLDNILKSMLKFGMSEELKCMLKSTMQFYGSSYIEAWSNVLLTPFKRLETPLAAGQKNECYEALKQLSCCPVLSQIELQPIWSNCVRLRVPEMATVVLPHVSPVERKKVIKSLGKIQTSVLQDIKGLKSKGIVTTNTVLAILKQEYSRGK